MHRGRRVSRIDRSLLVIAAGVAAAIHVGKLPPALPALQQALGIGLVTGGFLISMVQLAAMTLGLAVGLAADGLGLRRVMVSGLALQSAASLAGAFTTDVRVLLALRGLEGLGFLLAATPAPSLIRRHVAAQGLQSRLGLWGAYMPLGTALALLTGPVWIAAHGWPAWWLLTAALSAVMAVALWVGLPPDAGTPGCGARSHGAVGGMSPGRAAAAADVPPGSASGPSGPSGPTVSPTVPPPGAWRDRLALTLRAPGPWLVALAFGAYSAQWLAVVGFLPSIYAQAGFLPAAAGAATALAAAVNMVGNIVAGRLLQRGVAPQRLLQAGYLAMALGAVGLYAPLWPAGPLAFAGPYAAVLLFSCVGGLVPGTLFAQAVRLAPSPSAVSTTVGWMQQWSSFGQFAGPPLVAWVAGLAGGWSFSWMVTGTCAVAGLVLACRIGRLHARLAQSDGRAVGAGPPAA